MNTSIDTVTANATLEDFHDIASRHHKKYPLVEAFGPTIQGEGITAGQQTNFLRFGGCDYKCTKCDSLHAVIPSLIKQNATYVTLPQLLQVAEELQRRSPMQMITLSGGNPCIWDLADLVEFYNERDVKVAVETQGTIFQEWLMHCDDVTGSPKPPGMGERFEPDKFKVFVDRLYGYDPHYLKFCVKVPCFSRLDLEFVKQLVREFPQVKDCLYISVGNNFPPPPAQNPTPDLSHGEFVANILKSYEIMIDEVVHDPELRTAIILPQIHTLVWGNARGR